MIGTLLNDRYHLDAELGQGGMGVVYRAHDTLLERDVAVKVVRDSSLGTEGRARLLNEARAAAQLHHPNIIVVFDAGEANKHPFIVMELLEGHSLFERKPAALQETIAIIRQVCAALEHAHEHGIVHRDLKPENVMILPDGVVKLTDFGLARSASSRVTAEGTITGTVFYLAPEQALGLPVDGRADLYSLGVMLYELAAGRLPFNADDPLTLISQHLYAPVVPPSTYNAEIPHALDALIVRMLSKQPPDRLASAGEVARALDSLDWALSGGDGGLTATALEATSAAREPSPLSRLAVGRLTGREREFGQARALWKEVTAGIGEVNVLLISGEPGVGKTPLVREITTLAGVSRGRVLTATCYAEGNAPYVPIGQLVRDAMNFPLASPFVSGLNLPEPTGEAGGEKRLPQVDSGVQRRGLHAQVLSDLLSLAPDLRAAYPDLPPESPHEPQTQQQRLFEGMAALVSTLAAQGPVLVVVEDVHWADGGTLFTLRHLARRSRAARLPVLILLTYRETDLADACCLEDVLLDFTRERLALRIKLGRFDREQTREVLATMFGQEIAPEFLDAIYRETEGNLFFIEEICKALIEAGEIHSEGGQWHRRPGGGPIRLPQSVRATIQARVGRLSEAAQDALRLAAIIGREFDFETLQRASEQDEETLIGAIELAERMQLVSEVTKTAGHGYGNSRETFAFAHTLIPAALRESVSGLRRRRLHRRVAAAIEAVRPDDAAALAYHYAEAGDEARARIHHTRAGDRAAAVYANQDAIHFYTEALALAQDDRQRFDLLVRRARVYDMVANREAQRLDVDEMLTLAERLNDDASRCDALLAQADVLVATEYASARTPAQSAVALAEKLGDSVRQAHALRRLGWASWEMKEPHEARKALEAAIVRFREAGLLADAANSLHTLSLVLGSQGLGDLIGSQAAAEEAVSLSRQAGDRRQEAHGLRRLAIVHVGQARYAEALPYVEKALALHIELGDREGECHALNVFGLVLADLQRPDEAEAYLRRSLEIGDEIGSVVGMSNALGSLIAECYRPHGELEAALRLIEAQQARADLTGDKFWVCMLDSYKAEELYHLGMLDQALDLTRGMLSTVPSWGGPIHWAWLTRFAAFLEAELGNIDGAYRNLDLSSRYLEEQAPVQPTEIGILASMRAHVAWRDGERSGKLSQDPEPILTAGVEHADRAISLLKQNAGSDAQYHLAYAFFRAARLHLALSELPKPTPGAAEAALACSTEAVRLLNQVFSRVISTEVLYTHAEILRTTNHEAEAADYRRQAYEWVMLVAGKIKDETLRQNWLENVPANRMAIAALGTA